MIKCLSIVLTSVNQQHLHSTSRCLLVVPRYQLNFYCHSAFSTADITDNLQDLDTSFRYSLNTYFGYTSALEVLRQYSVQNKNLLTYSNDHK